MNAETAAAGDPIISRYSALARMALAGGPIADCDQETFDDGQFGAAAYDHTADALGAALRASLGCGNPVAVTDLHAGETVLDLGSGGGLDVLLSARRVGPSGVAYGVDGSEDMLALARANAAKAGVSNARFVFGRIEDVPLPDGHVDVVISNCVVNLSGDKPRVLGEAFRVLRPRGRLGISDVIADEDLDPAAREAAEQLIGCANGALTAHEYRELLAAAGFASVSVQLTSDAGGGLHSAIIKAIKPASRM
jgi:ubiquinone/menaquinone biosynthesis C-methylase UbiE